MLKPLLIFFLVFTFVNFKAQSFIKGQITDSLNEAIPYCAFGLLKSSDSTIIKGTVSDDKGNFSFDEIPKGTYKIKADNLGNSIIFPDILTIDSATLLNIQKLVFNYSTKNLNEVEVAVIKKPIEFKNGNIIVNIDGSPLAVGNTVFDLLSRLPGVTVIDDVISIQGTAGVKFYIDDRLQNVSGNQLINLLKGINASAVNTIEIMKRPPVKYDAAGSAGIINIKTKKIKIVGFSGSINETYTQAYFYNNSNNLELNYKGKKINFFSSLLYTDESFYRLNEFNRYVTFNSVTSLVKQTYKERMHNYFAGINIGADYYINSKNILGFKITSFGGNEIDTRVGDVIIENSDLNYDYSYYGHRRINPWSYTDANINYEHNFDTLGTKLIFSADYTYNYDLYSGDHFNNFVDRRIDTMLSPLLFKTYNYIYLNIGAAKLDFEKKFKNDIKLETGLKETYTNMISDFTFKSKNSFSGDYIIDSSLTNVFNYEEIISAAYFNLQGSYKKFNLQAGVRAENTEVNTRSLSNNVKYNRNYFNVFPLVSVDYTANKNNNISLSYNKRIERPNYNTFNPYRTFRNYINSEVGNPQLMPMYFNMITLSHNYKGQLNHSFTYNIIKNIFFQYNQQNDSTKENINYTTNFKHRDVFAYDIFYQKNIFKWWISSFNTSVIYFNYNGDLDGVNYKTEQYSYYISNNHQLIFPKNYKAEVNLFYIGPWLDGITNSNARWNLDLAIKKSFNKNKLNLVLGCNDIFFTSIFSGTSKFENINSNFKHYNDTRRIRFSISYNFGELKVRQRDIKSNQEESNRTNH